MGIKTSLAITSVIAFLLLTANWGQRLENPKPIQYKWEKEYPELNQIFPYAEEFQERYGIPKEVVLAIAQVQIEEKKSKKEKIDFSNISLFLDVLNLEEPKLPTIEEQITFLGQQLRDICQIELNQPDCWSSDPAKALKTIRPYIGASQADQFLGALSYILQESSPRESQESPKPTKNSGKKTLILTAGHWILPANTGAPNEAAHNMAIANEVEKHLEKKGWEVIRPDKEYLKNNSLYDQWVDPFYDAAKMLQRGEATAFIEIHGQGDATRGLGLGTIGKRGTPLNDRIAKNIEPHLKSQGTWTYGGNLFNNVEYNNSMLNRLAMLRVGSNQGKDIDRVVLVEAVRTPGPAPSSPEQKELAKNLGKAIADGVYQAFP